MVTKFVGVKEFRQNIATIAQKAQQGKARYVVMSRNKPLFAVQPFAASDTLDTLVADLAQAQADIGKGKFYTAEQILADISRHNEKKSR